MNKPYRMSLSTVIMRRRKAISLCAWMLYTKGEYNFGLVIYLLFEEMYNDLCHSMFRPLRNFLTNIIICSISKHDIVNTKCNKCNYYEMV